jgi:hypothetical protein
VKWELKHEYIVTLKQEGTVMPFPEEPEELFASVNATIAAGMIPVVFSVYIENDRPPVERLAACAAVPRAGCAPVPRVGEVVPFRGVKYEVVAVRDHSNESASWVQVVLRRPN